MSKLKMRWTGGTEGSGQYVKEDGSGKASLAIPTDKGGSGQGFAPRELLASAAGACYSTTLVSILESRNYPVSELSTETEVTKTDEIYEITHHPQVKLLSDATDKDRSGVERSFAIADRACTIGNLLKKGGAKVIVEGQITV